VPFFSGIQTFYRQHRLANATTADLRAALERSSGRPSRLVLPTVVVRARLPKLRVRWTRDSRSRDVVLTIEQTQPASWPTFRLPLTIELAGATSTRQRVEMTARTQTFRLRTTSEPTRVTVDPDEDVLKEIEPQDSPLGPTTMIDKRLFASLKGIALGDAIGKQTEDCRVAPCCAGIRRGCTVWKGQRVP
jgi:aminopeptidase N